MLEKNGDSNYTVDVLLETLSITANSKVWSKHPEIVSVQGTVASTNPWKDKLVYFELSGSGKKIKCRCDMTDQPKNGDQIVFEGRVYLQTTAMFTGLEVMLVGKPKGTWIANYAPDDAKKNELVKESRKPLGNLINEEDEGILVLGTTTGINDIRSTVEDCPLDIEYKTTVMSQKKNLLAVVKDLGTLEGYSAIAFVRGGDDDTLEVWNDPEIVKTLLDTKKPFFTAIGHSHSVTLADKYADQAFPTPSSLGDAINIEASRFYKAKEGQERASQNYHNIKKLQSKLDIANSQLQTPSKKQAAALSSALKPCLIGVVIGILCCLYFLY